MAKNTIDKNVLKKTVNAYKSNFDNMMELQRANQPYRLRKRLLSACTAGLKMVDSEKEDGTIITKKDLAELEEHELIELHKSQIEAIEMWLSEDKDEELPMEDN